MKIVFSYSPIFLRWSMSRPHGSPCFPPCRHRAPSSCRAAPCSPGQAPRDPARTTSVRPAACPAPGCRARSARCQPLLPHSVPTLVVRADVAIAPVLRQVIGIMRRLVRHVGEVGLPSPWLALMNPISLSRSASAGGTLGQLREIAPVLGEDRLRRRTGEVHHVPVAAGAVEQREVGVLEAARGRESVQAPCRDANSPTM